MAKLMLEGIVAQVEILTDPWQNDEDSVTAICRGHRAATGWTCTWGATYDDLNDAVEYATDHADEGR